MMSPAKPLLVALVGNPNTGKSTLFNALSGLRQHVGNYPGVTVEMKKGVCRRGDQQWDLLDLPGTYSLAARSPDEVVAVDLLLGRRPEEPPPDVILSIVDASNLDRHLYLTSQLLELGKPVVLVVNMMDVARNQGLILSLDQLRQELQIPVVPIQANRGEGLDHLLDTIILTAGQTPAPRASLLPAEVVTEAEALLPLLPAGTPAMIAQRLLLDVGSTTEQLAIAAAGESLRQRLTDARARLAAAGHSLTTLEARIRYAWIRHVVEKSVQKPEVRPKSWTDRLDKILIHRVWGTGIFLIIMFMMFQAIFVAAEPLMDLIESGTGWLSKKCTDLLPAGPVRSLLADGIISGVGGVLAFLPQILILFAFIAVLEDCGYMARAAYLMDRIMSRCGLSGKSFIPMLASVACAVPGIMATRVIENRRDRLATILVAPLMSCSARLPVYSLLIAAFLTENQPFWVPGLTLFVMYLIGFVVAPLVAWIVRKTLLRGERSPFLMELPAYKRPSLKLVVRRVWDAGGAFVRRAGSLILMSMVLIWALLYFPDRNTAGRYEDQIADLEQQVEKLQEKRESESTTEEEQQQLSEEQDDLNSRKATIMIEWKAGSLLGQTGQALEPLFSPLGWDWKIGMAALASFPAREVIVGTLSILYSAEPDDDDALRGKVSEEWSKDPIRGKYAVPVALSIMVFFALCCQCASTLAVIRRETRSWSWPLLTFTYMTLLAYVAAAATFQIGKLLVDAGS